MAKWSKKSELRIPPTAGLEERFWSLSCCWAIYKPVAAYKTENKASGMLLVRRVLIEKVLFYCRHFISASDSKHTLALQLISEEIHNFSSPASSSITRQDMCGPPRRRAILVSLQVRHRQQKQLSLVPESSYRWFAGNEVKTNIMTVIA